MLVLCIRVLHEVMESIPSSDGVILITFLCKLCSLSLLDTIANYKNSCLGLRILSINALHDAVETENKYKALSLARILHKIKAHLGVRYEAMRFCTL